VPSDITNTILIYQLDKNKDFYECLSWIAGYYALEIACYPIDKIRTIPKYGTFINKIYII